MFYWFQRGKDTMRYEMRALSDGYELVVTSTNGTEVSERVADTDALQARELELLGNLKGQGWTGPHGWYI